MMLFILSWVANLFKLFFCSLNSPPCLSRPNHDALRQLLTISNVGWEEVKGPFLQEALAREVQFILPRYPKYFPTLPSDEEHQAENCSTKFFFS